MNKNLKNILKQASQKLDRLIYRNKDFVIISNNCWGVEIYKRLGLEYNTPFIGLYIYSPDYIKLLENFDYYMKSELLFVNKSKWLDSGVTYPVGILEDIEIHFMHYKNEEEATSKWNRRLSRMLKVKDLNKYYFKICDRDFSNQSILMKFHELPYTHKISFGLKSLNIKNHIQIEENENNQTVPDGVKLYRYSFRYIDVLNWINSGVITKNLYCKIKSIANIQ